MIYIPKPNKLANISKAWSGFQSFYFAISNVEFNSKQMNP